MRKPVDERFWEKVVLGKGECLNWNAARDGNGYGKFYFQGRVVGAHRMAWFLEFEKWPTNGLQLDHLCRNILCVNVNHLELVTPRVNVLRSTSITARRSRQKHCSRGHEFTHENTWISPTSHRRRCRTCDKVREQLRYQKGKVP